MEVKRCRQCGILKEVDKFRLYTYSKRAETSGRYSICRECEAINSQYRRCLATCQDPAQPETKREEARSIVTQIRNLYEVLRERGLKVPEDSPQLIKREAAISSVAKLMEFYGGDAKVTNTTDAAVSGPEEIPDDLKVWLPSEELFTEWAEKELTPEYLQETVYEALRAKYRPQIGIDKEKFIPLYDDTYKSILNDILRGFDDYEEWFIQRQTWGEEQCTDA